MSNEANRTYLAARSTPCTTATCWWPGRRWRNCRSTGCSSSPQRARRSSRSSNRRPPQRGCGCCIWPLPVVPTARSIRRKSSVTASPTRSTRSAHYAARYPEAKTALSDRRRPRADVAAMARGHRLGQARRVSSVVPRPGQAVADFPEPFCGQALRGWPFEVSSSAIRERLRFGQSIDGLVPSAVAESLQNDNPYT